MGHVQDLWFKTVTDLETGRLERVKTSRHGKGKRYRVRYLDPDGRERSACFPDRQKKRADDFLTEIENDKRRGSYLDPRAGDLQLKGYADAWLASQTFDETTREAVDTRLRNHVYPELGSRPLTSITPSDIRSWDRSLQQRGLAASYRSAIFVYVQAILDAAVDDERIRKNPCKANSVRRPQVPSRKLKPWPVERVHAVRAALSERYRITVILGAGLGLRQGESFGLADVDIDSAGQLVHVTRQVKMIGGRPCFGPPKGGKTRDVPLPSSVARALLIHTERYPPAEVTLPWQKPDGKPVTATLIVYRPDQAPLRRQLFHSTVWRPALRRAGITPLTREDGFHALRHFYASTLLDSGESVVALAEYLGHHDPGFTLRTYTHLMPSSQQRTRRAVDRALRKPAPADGTTTA